MYIEKIVRRKRSSSGKIIEIPVEQLVEVPVDVIVENPVVREVVKEVNIYGTKTGRD